MKKIALEEHFLSPGMEGYLATTNTNINPNLFERAVKALADFGEARLAKMEEGGIDYAILSLAGPGVQAEPRTGTAVRLARESNDFLAEKVAGNPRYGALAHLAMQDPLAAATELERCVTQLGFHGAMINGITNGTYLDDDRFEVFWERAAALDAPVYIHPSNPADVPSMYNNHPELWGPVWSWTVETATHALRLVFAGVFERHPKARLILGHMGETLPFMLWRFDSRWAICNAGIWRLDAPPSHYIKRNVLVTTSGVCSSEPLLCALNALGEDNVMFSADHPFENAKIAADFMDSTPLPDDIRAKVAHGNAERLFRLGAPSA